VDMREERESNNNNILKKNKGEKKMGGGNGKQSWLTKFKTNYLAAVLDVH
jgi:hypothetical protein